jgi:hypothetical protein
MNLMKSEKLCKKTRENVNTQESQRVERHHTYLEGYANIKWNKPSTFETHDSHSCIRITAKFMKVMSRNFHYNAILCVIVTWFGHMIWVRWVIGNSWDFHFKKMNSPSSDKLFKQSAGVKSFNYIRQICRIVSLEHHCTIWNKMYELFIFNRGNSLIYLKGIPNLLIHWNRIMPLMLGGRGN